MTKPRALELRRVFRHAPSHVFHAFTQGRFVERWLAPADAIGTDVLDYEFQEGGRYRVRFSLPDGVIVTLGGIFEQVAPNERVVMSWCWEPPDVHAGIESRVTFDFASVEGGTELRLRHEGLGAAGMSDRHRKGWSGTLSRLESWIHAGSTTQENE